MINRHNIPEFVTLTVAYTTVRGFVKGIRYDIHECFETSCIVEHDEATYVSVIDSRGNRTCVPVDIVEKADVCPWKTPVAV